MQPSTTAAAGRQGCQESPTRSDAASPPYCDAAPPRLLLPPWIPAAPDRTCTLQSLILALAVPPRFALPLPCPSSHSPAPSLMCCCRTCCYQSRCTSAAPQPAVLPAPHVAHELGTAPGSSGSSSVSFWIRVSNSCSSCMQAEQARRVETVAVLGQWVVEGHYEGMGGFEPLLDLECEYADCRIEPHV